MDVFKLDHSVEHGDDYWSRNPTIFDRQITTSYTYAYINIYL